MADLSSAQLEAAATNGTRLVCISMFDVAHRGAYLKFLARRLRRILPHASLLGGFWKYSNGNTSVAEIAGIVPNQVKSLAEAVAFCLNKAVTIADGPIAARQTGNEVMEQLAG